MEQSTGSVTHPGVDRSLDEEEDNRKEWLPGPVSPEVNAGATILYFFKLKKIITYIVKGIKYIHLKSLLGEFSPMYILKYSPPRSSYRTIFQHST